MSLVNDNSSLSHYVNSLSVAGVPTYFDYWVSEDSESHGQCSSFFIDAVFLDPTS